MQGDLVTPTQGQRGHPSPLLQYMAQSRGAQMLVEGLNDTPHKSREEAMPLTSRGS